MRRLIGLLYIWLLLSGCVQNIKPIKSTTEYKHIPYVSTVAQENCFLCGERTDSPMYGYWGQDNLGILNLNTFDLQYIEINRYSDSGQLIEKSAGHMQMIHQKSIGAKIRSVVDSDRGYAHIQIQGDRTPIDADNIQNRLCQTCLDTINHMYFGQYPPEEYAIVNFSEKTIKPFVRNTTWFLSGSYGVDCQFEEDDRIDLLIFYCPPRYEN